MSKRAPAFLLPDAPAVVAGHGRAALLTTDGELLRLPAEACAHLLRAAPPPLLVHAPATLRRLGLGAQPCLDLLELFAFVLPARPVAPTPRGLAMALDLDLPGSQESAAALLPALAVALLRHLAAGRELALNAAAAGLAASQIAEVGDRAAAREQLLADLRPGDVVLVKASRGIALDVLVDELVAALGPRTDEAPQP